MKEIMKHRIGYIVLAGLCLLPALIGLLLTVVIEFSQPSRFGHVLLVFFLIATLFLCQPWAGFIGKRGIFLKVGKAFGHTEMEVRKQFYNPKGGGIL